MTVTPSTLVAKNSAIASVDDLWEPSTLFLPNWKSPVKVNATYRAVVGSSRSVSEQRLLLARKPRRTMTYSLRGYNTGDTERARAMLTRISRARTPMPIWSDGAALTGKPNMDVNAYSGDFEDKRFQVGARACALKEDSPGISTQFKYATITALTNSLITLDADLDESYATPPSIRWSDHLFETAINRDNKTTPALAPADIGDYIVASLHCMFGGGALPTLVSVTLTNTDTGVTTTVTGDVIIDEVTTRLDLTHVFLTTVTVATPVLAPGHYTATLTMSRNFFQAATYMTVVTGVSLSAPIHETASGNPATSDHRLVELEVTPDRANQLVLLHASSGAAGVGTFTAPTVPAGEPTIVLNQIGVGAVGSILDTQQSCLIQYVTTASGAVDVGINLPTFGAADAEGYHASAVVFNQKETDGFDMEYIFPVMECDLELRNTADAITDAVQGAAITLVETPGKSALDPEVTPGTNIIGFPTYKNPITGLTHPILTLPINWAGVKVGHFRMGKRERTGITTILQAYGTGPGATFNLPFLATDRHEAWDVLEFFDSRGGRAFPFWLITPSPVLTATAIGAGGDTIFLEPNINERDWDQYSYLGVYDKTLDSYSVHEITLSVRAGDDHILTIDPVLPNDDETRYDFGTAHLSRFNTESFEGSWITDEAEQVALPVAELINEKAVTVTLIDICGPGGGDPWCPDNDYDICAPLRCGTDDASGCCMCGLFGLSVIAHCFIGECLIDGCAAPDGCIENGECVGFFQYVSCIAGVMRWEDSGTSSSVELNTTTVSWTYDLIDWYIANNCCGEVDQGEACPCIVADSCPGEPIIITETCTKYTERHACDRFNGAGGDCDYVTVLELVAEENGQGSGSSECS